MEADDARVGATTMWGTWEELILGSAVLRHGTQDWNVIVSELRAHTAYPSLYTPEICKARYEDLLKDFSCAEDLVEELRKRRMDELKRDIAKSDVLICVLESKLRSMKAEKLCADHSSHTEPMRPTLNPKSEINIGSGSNDGDRDSCPPRTDTIMEIFNLVLEAEPASLFMYRLDSQKCARYREMIKQHVDMGSIRSRILGESIKSTKELFRDLLLLANNAIVFYSPRTLEYKSALSLRNLVTREYKIYRTRSPNNDGSQSTPSHALFNISPTVKQRRSIRLRSRLCKNKGTEKMFNDEEEDRTSEDPSDSDEDFLPRSSLSKGKMKKGSKRMGKQRCKNNPPRKRARR